LCAQGKDSDEQMIAEAEAAEAALNAATSGLDTNGENEQGAVAEELVTTDAGGATTAPTHVWQQ
jgi:hypothetical protein